MLLKTILLLPVPFMVYRNLKLFLMLVSVVQVLFEAIREAGMLICSNFLKSSKKTIFKITRAGELIGRKVAEKHGIPFGIVDISLAPTPLEGDSIGDILIAMGVEDVGAPGTAHSLC